MKNRLIILIFSISLLGCHPQGREFVEHKELSPLVEWLKKDVIEFKVPIENVQQEYRMSLAFRYVFGYEYEFIKVKVTEISPNGDEIVKEYELNLKDKDGKYVGDPGLSFFDSEHLIEASKTFNQTGIYTYKIEHMMPKDPVSYSLDLGLIFDRVN
jgi:gliding motility-associated lipoprotein GldH